MQSLPLQKSEYLQKSDFLIGAEDDLIDIHLEKPEEKGCF